MNKRTQREIHKDFPATFRSESALQIQFFNTGETDLNVFGVPVGAGESLVLGNSNFPEKFQIDCQQSEINPSAESELLIIWEEVSI